MSSFGSSLPVGAAPLFRPRSRWRLAGASFLLASTLSCGGKDSPTAPERIPSGFALASGDQQQAVVASNLTAPLVVKVVDQNEAPLSGQTVTFAVVRGGGTVDPASATTNADGLAQARWTLGTSADSQVVEARLVGAGGPTMTVRFHATALAGAPTAIAVAGGDGQRAPAGTALPSPLVVRLTDAFGNPTSGVTVTWAVTAGGGSITASSVTDADGRASAQWTLGATPGPNGASASVNGTTLTPASFTATGS